MANTPLLGGGRQVHPQPHVAAGVGWERYEVAASRVPRISKAFLEEERRALPARIFHQEYECSFEETDDQVFSYEDVTAAISDEVPPLFGGGAT